MAEFAKVAPHVNVLDWKEFSDYTAHFLSNFVISNGIDNLSDPGNVFVPQKQLKINQILIGFEAFIWSTTGVVLFFNIAMYNLIGWKAEEVYNLDPKLRLG